MSSVVETGRLRLRVPRADDDAFFLALLNDPDWHRFVSDPGVRDHAGAREWVESRLLKLQAEQGIDRLEAVTDPENAASIRLLERLGFEAAGFVRLPGEDLDLRRFTVRLRADTEE